MSELTPNLGLFKYDLSTDGKEVFSIEQALNSNWDIIDNMDLLPDQTDKENYVLTTDGVTAHWGETDEIYPVVQTFVDGSSWYRVYSDGWCEQGGYSYPATSTITFLKQFSNINYTLITQPCNKIATTGAASYMATFNHTVTGFSAIANMSIAGYEWQACGYIGEE